MSCCGGVAHRGAELEGTKRRLFEWKGKGPLTLFGGRTGIRYHFPGPGARLQVDPRDAPILELIQGMEPIPFHS
jgi:hypothetical protein